MLLSLPSPGQVPVLNDDVFNRLRRKWPGVLPSKVVTEPGSDCRTCAGKQQFRWLADPSKQIMPIKREIPRLGEPSKSDVVYEIPEVPQFADYACECWLQFRLQAFLLAHNIGKAGARTSWHDATWVADDQRDSLQGYADQCLDWAARGVGLYLYGEQFGSGKSLMANLVLKSYLAAGIEGHWMTFNEMLAMHTRGWSDKEERDWFETRVRNAQVLVIDDIGKESSFQPEIDGKRLPNNWRSIVVAALDSTFRARVQNGLVTIITSNVEPEQIGNNYSAALGSLVVETCIPYRFRSDEDARRLYRERTLAEIKFGLIRPFVFG
jgi:DNA replication protein DnaC